MRLLVAFTFLVFLIGCDFENPNKQVLEEAYLKADSISILIEDFPSDSIKSVRDRLNSAKKEIQWIGTETSVEFFREEAPVINSLSSASRYLKDAPRRIISLKYESDRCKKQITGLIDIIDSGANIDAKGDTINDLYIENNSIIEVEAVKKLEEVYSETERLIRLGLKTDSIHWNSIDSLITAKKGVWAKSIAKEE